jgi:hypothetical protein
MLSQNERNKKISFSPHTVQSFHERGKKLFPFCSTGEIYSECLAALRNPKKGIIIPDDRNGVDSTHHLIFVNDAGAMVVIPISVNTHDIHLFTMKNVKDDLVNPNWYIQKYNEIAGQRGIQTVPLIFNHKA